MTNRKHARFMAGGAAALTLLALGYAAGQAEKDDDEKEESIEFAKLPDPVKKTAEAYFGSSANLKAGKETEGGAVAYEIEGTKDGAKTEIEVSEGGVLAEVEKTLTLDQLPASIQAALKKEYPDGKFGAIEAHEAHFFEVKIGGKEMVVTAYGKIKPEEDDD